MTVVYSILLASLGLLGETSALPGIPSTAATPPVNLQLNNLTSAYTVTAFAPFNCEYNGLKIETWYVTSRLNLFSLDGRFFNRHLFLYPPSLLCHTLL